MDKLIDIVIGFEGGSTFSCPIPEKEEAATLEAIFQCVSSNSSQAFRINTTNYCYRPNKVIFFYSKEHKDTPSAIERIAAVAEKQAESGEEWR